MGKSQYWTTSGFELPIKSASWIGESSLLFMSTKIIHASNTIYTRIPINMTAMIRYGAYKIVYNLGRGVRLDIVHFTKFLK